MATQNCPRCSSSRIRIGYKPTPILKKIIFRYNLLCDSCNWEFEGYAIPGSVPRKTKKSRKVEEQAIQNSQEIPKLNTSNPGRIKIKKRVRLADSKLKTY